jgi:hypothetical protein
MELRLGFTAPSAFVFEAQRQVRMVGGQLEQAVAVFFAARRAGRD